MDILFKKLVDSTKPSLNLSSVEDLESLYERYRIEYKNILSPYEVHKHLYKTIQNNLLGNDLSITKLFLIKD